MAERTHEETEQTEGQAGEEHEASSNGDALPSGTLSTGAALTIGGAVVGALLALLHVRRAAEADGADTGSDPGLADELTARASEAARGGEAESEESDEQDEADDEANGDAVGVAQAAEADEEEAGSEATGAGAARRRPRSAAERETRTTRTRRPPSPRGRSSLSDDTESERRAGGAEAREEEPRTTTASRRRAGDGRPEGGALAAAKAAARQLAQLTGKTPESVVGVERRDGGWRVTLEVVEVSRTPPTTDVLGSYEVELDGDSELVEYRQVGRYVRGRAAEGG